jgi:lysophospholipase L1-like esterase
VRAVAASDAGPVGGEAAEVVGTGTGGVAVRWPPVGPVPRLLIVAPTPIGALDDRMRPHFAPEHRAQEVSRELAAAYRAVAAATGAAFFDAGTVVSVGSDGVHLDIAGQRVLGNALAEQVRAILED